MDAERTCAKEYPDPDGCTWVDVAEADGVVDDDATAEGEPTDPLENTVAADDATVLQIVLWTPQWDFWQLESQYLPRQMGKRRNSVRVAIFQLF